jgi:hypothetical protein
MLLKRGVAWDFHAEIGDFSDNQVRILSLDPEWVGLSVERKCRAGPGSDDSMRIFMIHPE